MEVENGEDGDDDGSRGDCKRREEMQVSAGMVDRGDDVERAGCGWVVLGARGDGKEMKEVLGRGGSCGCNMVGLGLGLGL